MTSPLESFNVILQEATAQVEEDLALEDKGWIKLGSGTGAITTDSERITNLKLSRTYATFDPLAKQAIRLWTDYSIGNGITFNVEDDKAQTLLQEYWEDIANNSCLSAMGQRRSSDKLLIDGEVFFVLFIGKGKTTIRRIDPLEITSIITESDDLENILYYKRVNSDSTGYSHTRYYRSLANELWLDGKDNSVTINKANAEKGICYHVPFATIEQRGNPLLLPCLDWLKLHRRYMASRVAVMLAMARFAWKIKQEGGADAIATTKASFHEEQQKSASTIIENMGATMTPISAPTGASGAYQDGRMLKLLIASATGIPEQYFGDISIGNLATAKTVELPMMKMFLSYQTLWRDAYDLMDRLVLDNAGVSRDVAIDRDFPGIAPEDQTELAKAIQTIVTTFPKFKHSHDVMQSALLSIGVNNTQDVIDTMDEYEKEHPTPTPPPLPPPQFQPNEEADFVHSLGKYTNYLKELLEKERDVEEKG